VSKRSYLTADRILDYMVGHATAETEPQRALRAATDRLPNAGMRSSPEAAQLLRFLVEAIGAKRAIEVGTFTGYGALAIALGLPTDGRLITCDTDARVDLARKAWAAAGVADRIELRAGPALATLDGLIADGQAGRFDFAFIDADKPNYANYYERCLTLLRPRGIVAVDNVLWGGSVVEANAGRGESTAAIKSFNDMVARDARVTVAMLAVGDGLTLACKRASLPNSV
jgi:caffeoyl-CoA O-methyltransferase